MKTEHPLYTQDFLLNGKVSIRQSCEGYRAAIDPVFLAASTPAKSGDKVLDVGIGTGAASLCLMSRVTGLRVDGLDVQSTMLDHAMQNAKANNVEIGLIKGDVASGNIPELEKNSYDCVMTNPPFMNGGLDSPNDTIAKAHKESSCSLSDWIDYCVKMVKPRGYFSIIHRADRTAEILHYLYGKLGNIVIIPLWSKQNQNAKRIIIVGRKGVKTPQIMHRGIVVHNQDGSYTKDAESILKDAQPILF
jgi:tRNA1(Val) A37 N6-methylase TrmN6